MEVAEIVRLLGGAAESNPLMRRYRVSKHELRTALEAGVLLRVRRGCYAVPDADPVRVAEVAWRGVATCVTAAARAGLPAVRDDDRIHLLIRADRSQSGRNLSIPPGIVVHRGEPLALTHHSLAMAIDQAASCCSKLEQLVVVDAALHSGRLTLDQVARFKEGSQRRREWLVRYADARAESPAETLARVAMRRAGIDVESQVPVPHVGRVDFVAGARLIVEIDGRDYHSDPSAYIRDRRRDRAATAGQWRVLRFAASEVFEDARAVALEVRSVLEALQSRL